jgi:hypothetical protein
MIVCDICKKELNGIWGIYHLVHDFSVISSVGFPSQNHFCSKDCIQEWLDKTSNTRLKILELLEEEV